MSERLHELLRQKRLLQEHLAWLDREIAAADGGLEASALTPIAAPAPSASTSPASPVAPAPDPLSGAPGPLDREATGILERYQQSPQTLQSDVKRGCLIAFATGMCGLIITVGAALYFYSIKRAAELDSAPAIEETRP